MKFSKLKMTNKISTHGLIYFNDSENPIGGLLVYNDNQINLTFVLTGFIDTLEDKGIEVENITFLTSEGEYLELSGGIVINSKVNSNNITTIEIIYQYLLLNINPRIESESEENYNDLKIYCTYFKDIFSNSPFRYGKKKNEKFHSKIETQLKSTLGVCLIDKGVEVSDFIHANQNSYGEDFDLKLDYTPFLNVRLREPLPFNDMISLAIKIRNIISFITNHKIKVEELYISKNKKAYKVFWINEFNNQVPQASQELKFGIKPFIKRNFNGIISGYFLNEEKLTDIFETYVNNIYRPIYKDEYLVSHIIILEGLHRRFVSDKKTSLKTRLEEILGTLGNKILDKICIESEAEGLNIDEKLISYLVEFRHYHSHFFNTEQKPNIDIDKLEISRVLREVIKEFIYLKMNIGESYILTKSGQYSFENLPDFKN